MKNEKTRGVVFSFEALLTLLAAVALMTCFRTTSQQDFSYSRVYELQLVQDFLETTTKNAATNELLIEFLNGNPHADNQLQSFFGTIAKQTSSTCFILEVRGKKLESANCVKTRNCVSAQAIAFDYRKNTFIKIKGEACF